MRLNLKRVMSWCGGLAVALVAALSTESASAQQFIEVLPEVGAVTVRQVGDFYDISEERLADPAPGFRAYNIWATVKNPATSQGRYINAFQQLNITGVHQIWEQVGRQRFPTQYPGYFDELSDFIGAANVEKLKSLDSYMGFTKEMQSNGADPSETNNASNPGGLVLDIPDFTGVIGVGDLGVFQRTPGGAPAALGLATREGRLHLAKIVLYQGATATADQYVTASLSGQIGGQGDGNEGNGGEIDSYSNVRIGGTIMVPVPEPAMGVLGLLGAVSMLGLRRRNG